MDRTEGGYAPPAHRRLVIAALFLLFVWDVSGQTVPNINVYLQEEPVQEGSTFFVYIEVPADYREGFSFGAPPVQDGLRYWAGPALIQAGSPASAPELTPLTYRYSYRADRAGYVTLEPFTLRWQGQLLRSPELYIPVTADGLLIPPELEWRIPPDPIYLGQTVYISLDMYNMPEVVFPDLLTIDAASQGILEEVTGLGQLSTYEFAGETLTRIPLATFLYTPLADGTLRIPDIQAQFSGYAREVPAETLNVLPLPEAAEGDAVGSFQLEISPLPESIGVDNQFTFELSASGEGNLGVLKLPEPAVQNGFIEGVEEMDNYEATENGYAGSRTNRYRIRSGLSGEIVITIPAFTWFNPQTAAVHSSDRQIQRVAIIPFDEPEHPSFSEFAGKIELAPILAVNFSERLIGALLFLLIPLYLAIYLSITKRWRGRGVKGFVVFTLISLLMAGLVLRQVKPAPSPEEELEAFYRLSNAAIVSPSSTPAAPVLAQGGTLLKQNPKNIPLLFSLARLEYASGSQARTIFLMRRLATLEPTHPDFRTALAILEAEMSLPNQHPINAPIHGDWAYIIILLLFLLAAIYLSSVNFALSLNIPVVLGGLAFVIALFFTTGLYYIYYQGVNNQPAVIQDGGSVLKKIPDSDAADWIFLPGGTTVVPGVAIEGYVQIRTAYGIVAWLPEGQLLDG